MTLKLIYTFLFLSIIPIASFAHSGGTDANGCHAGSQPYHCHNGGTSSSGSSGGDAGSIISAAVAVTAVWAVWYYCFRDDVLYGVAESHKEKTPSFLPVVEAAADGNEQSITIGFSYLY